MSCGAKPNQIFQHTSDGLTRIYDRLWTDEQVVGVKSPQSCLDIKGEAGEPTLFLFLFCIESGSQCNEYLLPLRWSHIDWTLVP